MDTPIRNKEEYFNRMAKRKENAKNRIMNTDATKPTPNVSHVDVANQVLKVIAVLDIHPTVKKIMTMRIMGPLSTGIETSHMNIALTIGMREEQVREAEAEGLAVLSEALQAVSSKEFIEKFNKDKKVDQAVKEIKNVGKSAKADVQQKGMEYENKKFII